MLPISSRKFRKLFYRLVFFLSLVINVSGCATDANRNGSVKKASNSVELTTTPFYPQSQYQCGPASLATVLNATGLHIDPDALSEQVYLPDRKGSLQVEMIAAVRRNGRVPYQLGQNLQLVLDQLNDGLPVLVFLNLGLKLLPIYHYAVVIGYEPESDTIIMRSGIDSRRLMTRQRFLSAWNKAGSWSLIVLQPGILPAGIDLQRYLKSIIAMEAVGQLDAAELSYRAILKRWPNNTLAQFGLANTFRAQGKLVAATDQYSMVIKLDASHKPARNNLADTLLRLGRCEEATAIFDPDIMLSNPQSPIDRTIRKTVVEINAACSNSHQVQ